MRKIIRFFNSGNVCVCGLRGRGKDMLMANVIARRRLDYVSNTDFGGNHIPFYPLNYDCGGNTYENFLRGNLRYYDYPHEDGTDIYISDAGVYFPSQYCKELNRNFGFFSTFMALSRHLGECNVHFNVQNLNRVWDKIREQSDIYIMCNWCRVLFGKIVLQKVTVYESYESAVNRVPPYRSPRVFMNNDRRFSLALDKQKYRIAHGDIRRYTLLYWNRSNYDTRVFKEMLLRGQRHKK